MFISALIPKSFLIHKSQKVKPKRICGTMAGRCLNSQTCYKMIILILINNNNNNHNHDYGHNDSKHVMILVNYYNHYFNK